MRLLQFIVLTMFSTFSFSQETKYQSLNIDKSLTENADAVVRLNSLDVTIESKRKAVVNHRRVITVLNEKGNRYVNAGVGYDKYLKIKRIEAYIYDSFGGLIKKIKRKDFIDHSVVNGGALYTDSRVLFMGYTPISYPYTIEFLCEIETANTAAIPSWSPIENYYLSIEKDSYVLKDFANLGLRTKEKYFEKYGIIKSNSKAALDYSIENVKAIKPEDLSPTLHHFTPQVQIAVENFHYNGIDGKAKNWIEFGNWVNDFLLKGRDEVTEKTKEKILSLIKGTEDPIEKAKIVYDFVQNNTRYISVQVGIGGIQPISAKEVDQLKYGDCKGLTNYAQSLLKIAGVKSYYTVVEAGGEIIDFEKDFASLEQGNHIILGIPNKGEMIWLDCTSQIHPFGFIGDFTDNRNVLVVDKDSSRVLKTSKYLNGINSQYTKATIDLTEDASISSDVIIKTKGVQYDNRFIIERESNDDIVEYYKEHWGDINNLVVDKYLFENKEESVEFIETVSVHAKNYASVTGDRLIFVANVFNKNNAIPHRYRNRKMPLEINRGYLDEDVFIFRIPVNCDVESVPKNVSIKNKFGEFNTEYLIKDKEIVYKRKVLILNGKYPKSEYEGYRDFKKEISKSDNSKIVLIKN